MYPLDKKVKRGKVIEIRATGLVIAAYWLINGVPGSMLLEVGYEVDILTMLDEL